MILMERYCYCSSILASAAARTCQTCSAYSGSVFPTRFPTVDDLTAAPPVTPAHVQFHFRCDLKRDVQEREEQRVKGQGRLQGHRRHHMYNVPVAGLRWVDVLTCSGMMSPSLPPVFFYLKRNFFGILSLKIISVVFT